MSATPPHVLGIGASAGGLEALLALLGGLPACAGLAVVVAQHMARDGQDALLARLVAREAGMPAVLAGSGSALRTDAIQVIPAGYDGVVVGARIELRPPTHLSTPSIDALFTSIAESHRERALGVVLSGAGSDGVGGCRALKSRGGRTYVQDPSEARFDGMPGAVIGAGLADVVLPAAAIGAALARRFGAGATPPAEPDAGAAPVAAASATAPSDPEFAELLQRLRQVTGVDFAQYKEDTLLRRWAGRRATLGLGSNAEYLALARRDPGELRTLQRLFLVSWSAFFRDAASFERLNQVLEPALAGRSAGEPVRIWVPGCATGEEAYTLAMLCAERQDRCGSPEAVQITGTDLNPDALAVARAARYPLSACAEMPPAARRRHLTMAGARVEVRSELRDGVTFVEGDVLGGPPNGLRDLDLISCRNLLIYLKAEPQQRLLAYFHAALRRDGLLFLGPAESLHAVGDAGFEEVDAPHRLFRRRHDAAPVRR